MTATERRYRGASDEIASMDNPDLYGDTFELLSFSKALDTDPPPDTGSSLSVSI